MFKNYTKAEKRKLPFVAAMLAFPILQFLVFYVYLNFNTFVLAFTDLRGNFSLTYFREIWKEWNNPTLLSIQTSLLHSFITWCCSTFLVFPVTVLFTYALYKKVRGEMVFRVIFYLPSILGSVVVSTLFRYLLDGPISELMYNKGWISEELYQMGFFFGGVSFKTVLFYGCWLGFCGNIVVLTGAMSRIPAEVLEAARLDGIGAMREFFQIILPLVWPTISTLLIYSLAGIFTADCGTYLLTGLGNSEATTMSYYLFNYIYYVTQSGNTSGVHYPAAVGVCITVLTLPVVLLIRHLLEKHTDEIVY